VVSVGLVTVVVIIIIIIISIVKYICISLLVGFDGQLPILVACHIYTVSGALFGEICCQINVPMLLLLGLLLLGNNVDINEY